tara:strand:- start:129 stop:656 length:528 start_codon:yes stop_codon:yes gene_type:complete
MNNFTYEELRIKHESVQDDMISMMKTDLSIIKKLEEEIKGLKKNNEEALSVSDFKNFLTQAEQLGEDKAHAEWQDLLEEHLGADVWESGETLVPDFAIHFKELKEENEKLKKQLAEMTQFHEWDKVANEKWAELINETLKEDIEEQLAAVECLQFMDYTYKDGRWFDEDDEEEED